MGAAPANSVESGPVTRWIEGAAVAYLFRNTPNAASANAVLAAFVVAALWPDIAPTALLGWFLLVVVVTSGRLWLRVRYRRTTEPDPMTWCRRYTAGLLVNGALWGLAVPLFALWVSPLQQMVIIIAIAGLTAGALPMNAVVLGTYIGFLYTATVPVAITYIAYTAIGAGQREHLVLGIITLAYATALTLAARTYNADQRSAHALSARLHEANRALEHRASHDALTGLWNRDRFELALDHEFDRKGRYRGRFSLIMLDIDRFKRVNDDHGHEVGDTVLHELANVLRQELRAPDQAGRWGGEEFMVLLPETDTAAAEQLAQRLRERFAALWLEGAGPVTISLGVSSSDASEDRTELLKRLDDALYAAKQSGRNRVARREQPARRQ